MEIFKSSFILQKADALWSALSKKFRSGVVCAVIMWLWRLWQGSFVYSFLTRPSALDGKKDGSVLLKALLWCLNLPAELLHRLYRKKPELLDGSVFFALVDHGALAVICALTLLMLVTPQKMWNNTYSLVLTVLALVLFWLSGARHPERRLSFEGIGAWVLIFGLIALCSAFWSQSFSYSFRFLLFALTCVLLVLVLVNSVNSEKQLMAVVCCVAVGLAINSGFAMYQRLTGVEVDPMLTDISANASMPGRVYSFFENPNSYANMLVLFAPVTLSLFVVEERKRQKLGYLAVTVLCCAALLLTYCRAGWASLALAMLVLLLITAPRYVPAVIIIGLLALPVLPDNIKNRLLTIFTGDTSIGTRKYIYSGTAGVIASTPIFGAGLGTKTVKSASYVTNSYVLKNTPFVHAHNIYLEIWAESGVFCLIAFVLAGFYLFRSAAGTARDKAVSLKLRAISAGCASGLIGSALFGMTDYAWGYPRVMVIYWLFIAIMCSAVKLGGREKKENG